MRAPTTVSRPTNATDNSSEGGRIPADALSSFRPLPEQPLVSIVVPALNEARYIGPLIDSVEHQSWPPSAIELLIADGGSEDGTRDIITQRAATSPLAALRLVENPDRLTPHALNRGVEASTGHIIIILGAHADIDTHFVEANVSALRQTGAAATGGPIETLGHGRRGSAIAIALSHPFGVGDAKFRYADQPGEVDTIAFAAYRRECFDVLGGFDPTRVNAEDGHFNFRIREAGGILWLDPAIRSRYYAGRDYTALWRQYLRYGDGKMSAILEEPAFLRPRQLAPTAMVAGGSILALASLISPRIRLAFGALGASYAALATYAAWRAASRHGDPPLATRIAPAFPIMHTAYGLGSLRAIARRLLRR